jgi:SAM-dependent methyltransferase
MDPRIYKQLAEIEQTHWWFRGRRRILTAVLARCAVRASSILDVGCGAGTNLDLLRDLHPGSRMVGIDIEYGPLSHYRAAHAAALAQADVRRLPFEARAFDLVTALDAIEHVEDDLSVLRELHRVCRPGGHVLLTVPAFPFLWGNVDDLGHHHRRYRKRELLERVVGAGFAIRFVRFFNYLLFPPIAAVRVLARLAPPLNSESAATVRSDFDLVKTGPLNRLLAGIFSLEARTLALRVPVGVSLVCVASRG